MLGYRCILLLVNKTKHQLAMLAAHSACAMMLAMGYISCNCFNATKLDCDRL